MSYIMSQKENSYFSNTDRLNYSPLPQPGCLNLASLTPDNIFGNNFLSNIL